jgi:NAD(P)-dependent dehydrogenase (short-subunit alcohol dehydrogenase family)
VEGLVMDVFRDKTAIVTGGASGIGKALCEVLAKCGAEVVVADIDVEEARDVAESLKASGGHAESVRLDVTSEEDVGDLVDETAVKSGRLDYIFNNAGIGIGGEVQDMDLGHWKRIVDVNQWGVVHGTLAAYNVMVNQGTGHIVNTASSAGLVPSPLLTAYSMTKHAVVGLSTGLRAEGAALGVKVSVVCPGFIDTPIFDSTEYVNTSKEISMSVVPPGLKAMGAEDCARAVLRGVARNRGIIPVQAPAYILWWLYRLSPRLLDAQAKRAIRQYRKAAVEKRTDGNGT